MLDPTDWLYVILGGLALIAFSWFVGRCFDPTYQAKRRRQFLRTNTVVVKLVTKDRKTIDSIVMNVDNARIKFGDSIIAMDNSRIYRENKRQEGFVIKQKHIKWEEGVPTVYVYADSLKPVDFFDEPSKVSAEDVGTVMISFVRLEIMKGLEAIKKYEMFFIIIGFLLVVVGLIGYFTYQAATNAEKNAQAALEGVNDIKNHFGIVTNETFHNSSAVVYRS